MRSNGITELGSEKTVNVIRNARSFDVLPTDTGILLSHRNSTCCVSVTAEGFDAREGEACAELVSDGDSLTLRLTYEDGGICEKTVSPTELVGIAVFFNYGPYEKESATDLEWAHTCCECVADKVSLLGEDLLNQYEKELYRNKDYVCLTAFPFFAGFMPEEELTSAAEGISDDRDLTDALEKYLDCRYGLLGKSNLARLEKELLRHRRTAFDGKKYRELSMNAVKEFLCPLDTEQKEKYAALCESISRHMREHGYGGEYPCFEKEDKYVRFSFQLWGDGYFDVRFGTGGKAPKKFVNPENLTDALQIYVFSEGVEDKLDIYIDGIVALLDGKKPSRRFKELITDKSVRRRRGMNVLGAVLCAVLSACLGAIVISGLAADYPRSLVTMWDKALVGITAALLLLGFGVYLAFFRDGCIRYLRRDKGE